MTFKQIVEELTEDAVDPEFGGKYRGYSITRKTRRIDKRNPISGHQWAEYEYVNGFDLGGPYVLPNTSFRSVKKAMDHVDFMIKFGLNAGEGIPRSEREIEAGKKNS